MTTYFVSTIFLSPSQILPNCLSKTACSKKYWLNMPTKYNTHSNFYFLFNSGWWWWCKDLEDLDSFFWLHCWPLSSQNIVIDFFRFSVHGMRIIFHYSWKKIFLKFFAFHTERHVTSARYSQFSYNETYALKKIPCSAYLTGKRYRACGKIRFG